MKHGSENTLLYVQYNTMAITEQESLPETHLNQVGRALETTRVTSKAKFVAHSLGLPCYVCVFDHCMCGYTLISNCAKQWDT